MGEKRARQQRKQERLRRTWCWGRTHTVFALLLGLVFAAVAAFRTYRSWYPTEQRCPEETDRFHEHCREGRKHYMIGLDWDCLGKARAAVMARALGLPDGKKLRGVGIVPSWLTEANANAVRDAPCIQSLRTDLACRYCVPTPRLASTQASSDGLETAGSANEESTAEAQIRKFVRAQM